MDKWKQTKSVFTKTLEYLIKIKAITVNEIYNIEGLASIFANDLSTLESEEIKSNEIQQMLTLLQKYNPDLYQEFLKSLSKTPERKIK